MMRSTRYLIIMRAYDGCPEERFERLEKSKAMELIAQINAAGRTATLCKIVSEIVGVFEPKAVKP